MFLTLLVFVMVWVLVSVLVAGISWAATVAGVRPGIFLTINVFLIWVLSPAVGAGVAVYAMIERFASVDAKTIFVGFTSACGALAALMFIFDLLLHLSGQGNGWKTVLFATQVVAIFGGAKIGSFAGVSLRPSNQKSEAGFD